MSYVSNCAISVSSVFHFQQLYRLTFWTRFSKEERKDINVWRKYGDDEAKQLNASNKAYELEEKKYETNGNVDKKDSEEAKDPEDQDMLRTGKLLQSFKFCKRAVIFFGRGPRFLLCQNSRVLLHDPPPHQ